MCLMVVLIANIQYAYVHCLICTGQQPPDSFVLKVLCVFSPHGNVWQRDFTYVQPYNYTPGKQDMVTSNKRVPGEWQQMKEIFLKGFNNSGTLLLQSFWKYYY